MSNRFEQGGPGFLDLAAEHLKKAKTFLDDVERLVDWRPSEKILKKKLRRNQDAIGNPAYPPLAMFKVLLLQGWWSLSDQGMDHALSDRISFRRFVGLSFSHDMPDQQLETRKLIVKQGIIVDASIVESARRPRKVEVGEELEDSQEDDPHYEVNTTYSDDHEARYLGMLKVKLELRLNAMAFNLKKAALMME